MTKHRAETAEHCTLCHVLNTEFDDKGLPDDCCCCRMHKAHGGRFPPEALT